MNNMKVTIKTIKGAEISFEEEGTSILLLIEGVTYEIAATEFWRLVKVLEIK
jgi:predicted metal-dependent phosphoesterase TrpH